LDNRLIISEEKKILTEIKEYLKPFYIEAFTDKGKDKNMKRMEIEGNKQKQNTKIMKTRKKIKSGEENFMPPSDYEESSSESIQSEIESPESPQKRKPRPEEYKNLFTSPAPTLNPETNNKSSESHETNLNISLNPSDSVSQISCSNISGKRPRKKLDLWDDFTKIADKEGFEKFKCKLCNNQTYSINTSTSILKRHIALCKQKIMEEENRISQNNKITSFYQKKTDAFSNEKAYDLTVNFIIKNHLPLSLVDNKEFLDLTKYLNKDYKLVCK